MSYIFYPKRGLEASRLDVLPEYGEFIYTRDERKLYIGDGKTKGGIFIGNMPKEVTLFDTVMEPALAKRIPNKEENIFDKICDFFSD